MSNTGLSVRQLEILSLKAAGLTERQIAQDLDIQVHTVRAHVTNILDKLKVCNSTAAVVVAIRDGDIDLDKLEIARRGCCD